MFQTLCWARNMWFINSIFLQVIIILSMSCILKGLKFEVVKKLAFHNEEGVSQKQYLL